MTFKKYNYSLLILVMQMKNEMQKYQHLNTTLVLQYKIIITIVTSYVYNRDLDVLLFP